MNKKLDQYEYQVEDWLTTEALEYSSYWNNEAMEMDKPFYVLNGNYRKLEEYLESSGLVRHLEKCVELARAEFGRTLHGVGCDLAAGTLWAEPHLFRLGGGRR